MSGKRISTELIESVRALNAVEQVVSEHVQLRRSGSELVGKCPFHADSRPSLYVCPSKAVFKCHGCQAAGDVFEFVRLLHHCSFPESVELLATRGGIKVDGFKPTPELTAKVSALKSQREEQMRFLRFFNERIVAVNQQYRSLGRAATHAEDYLRTGAPDAYLQDLAWSALERFRLFEIRVEREGLVDPGVLRTEWSQLRNVA